MSHIVAVFSNIFSWSFFQNLLKHCICIFFSSFAHFSRGVLFFRHVLAWMSICQSIPLTRIWKVVLYTFVGVNMHYRLYILQCVRTKESREGQYSIRSSYLFICPSNYPKLSHMFSLIIFFFLCFSFILFSHVLPSCSFFTTFLHILFMSTDLFAKFAKLLTILDIIIKKFLEKSFY